MAMQLIGMLDSPYVRRVAISMKLMGLPFEHRSLSVFRQYDEFAAINPVVKAPTLVTDDGVVLMDSTLILDHLDRLVPAERRLCPAEVAGHARVQRLVGLALAACEKSVQIVYERNLRPAEKQHEPWIERVRGQLHAAYRALEAEVADGQEWLAPADGKASQADVTLAVAWSFSRALLPDVVAEGDYPGIARHAAGMEQSPEFRSTPMN